MRVRQYVVCRGRAQQLLGTAATQAVLAAIGGPGDFGGTLQTLTLPTEWTPGGAGSLTDSTTRDHRVVLTDTERVRWVENYDNNFHLMLL